MGLLVRLFFSVCKGKQLYSENNRFSGYWSNKFRKFLCNYLFYREISIIRKAPPSLPKPPPRPLRKEGSAYAHTRDKGGQGSLSDSFLQNTCELALPSFTSLRSVTVGSEGPGEAFLSPITKSQSQNHKKDFQCVKGDSYII